MRVALSIAGSDPSGGAGIQADLKTFHQFGVYGMAAITALTAQNTVGVTGVHVVPPDFLRLQLEALAADLPPDAIKTGMLADADLVTTVADCIRAFGWTPLVVDPVMIATSGDRLLSIDAEQVIRNRLLPLATLVTPNLDEAALLTGLEVRDVAQMERAGTVLLDSGAAAVLLKGGHLDGGTIVDLLFTRRGHPAVQSCADRDDVDARNRVHAVGGDHGRAGSRASTGAGGGGGAGLRREGHRDGAGAGAGHGPLNHFALARHRPARAGRLRRHASTERGALKRGAPPRGLGAGHMDVRSGPPGSDLRRAHRAPRSPGASSARPGPARPDPHGPTASQPA